MGNYLKDQRVGKHVTLKANDEVIKIHIPLIKLI